MRVRDRLKGLWPPNWSGCYGEGTQFLIGEPEGLVLKRVELKSDLPSILISDESGGKSYTGVFTRDALEVINPDYPELFQNLFVLLKSSIGKEIRQIGDSEI